MNSNNNKEKLKMEILESVKKVKELSGDLLMQEKFKNDRAIKQINEKSENILKKQNSR